MNYLTSILLSVISLSGFCQTGFYKTLNSGFDDYPQCSVSAPNNEIIIGGYSKLNSNDWAIYIAKYDQNGIQQWHKRLNGSSKDLLHDIDLTSDGGFILSGRTWSYLTMGGDAFITKLDANGNQLFTTVVDGYQNYYNAGLAVDELSNGEFIQIGKHHLFYNPVRYDWEVNRYSASGSHIDSYVIGKVDGDDGAFDILALDNNEYIAVGYTEDLTSGDDLSFLYANQIGTTLYFASYTGSGTDRNVRIIKNMDGTFYMAGYTNSFGAGGYDFSVIKMDGFWNIIWQKTYGGPDEEMLMDICSDGNFGLVMGGTTDGFNAQSIDNLIIRIDPFGNLIKAVSFGGAYDESIESIILDSSSNFIFQSKTNSFTNGISNDIIFLKTDSLFFPGCNFREVPIQVNNASYSTVLNASKSTGSINNTNTLMNSSNQAFTELDLMPVVDAGPDQMICTYDTTVLIAFNPNNSTITWSGGITDGIPFVPNNDSSYYIVSANKNDCTIEDSVLIEIEDALLVNFTADTLYGCYPLNINFNEQSSQQNTISCLWNYGDGSTSNLCGSSSNTYTDTGCYDVSLTLTSINGCIFDSTISNMICIYEPPIASFSFSPLFLSFDDTLVSFINNSIGGVTYFWDFNGLGNSILENPDFIFPGMGLYDINLIVTSQNGCSDSIIQQIEIGTGLTFFLPNTFTPNGDGLNELFTPVSYGVDPNHYSIKIFNRWGEVVYSSKNLTEGWDGTYKGEIVQEDMYIWLIQFHDLKNEVKKYTGHVFVMK